MVDKSIQYYQGQLVIKKTSTTVTDDEGEEVIRTVRVLEDGSRVIEEKKPTKRNRSSRGITSKASDDPDAQATGVEVDDVKFASGTYVVPESATKHQETAPTPAMMIPYGAPQPGLQQIPQQQFYPNGQPFYPNGVPPPPPGQQVGYQVPYNEDKERCCGCTCPVFWAICCTITVAIGLILWFVVIRRLYWWRNLRGWTDVDYSSLYEDDYYNRYDDYYRY